MEGEKVENKKREKKLNASASKDQKAMTNEIYSLEAKVSIDKLSKESICLGEQLGWTMEPDQPNQRIL